MESLAEFQEIMDSVEAAAEARGGRFVLDFALVGGGGLVLGIGLLLVEVILGLLDGVVFRFAGFFIAASSGFLLGAAFASRQLRNEITKLLRR